MSVAFKVIDNRTSFSSKIKDLEQKLDNYRTFFLQGTADVLIMNSPVITGNYANSFTVGTSRASGSTSSFGKEKDYDYGTHLQTGIDSLYADIARLPDAGLTSIVFTNKAEYAYDVEYTLGHAPFTKARNLASQISDKAAARARST
jgi:hypothetical protein